MSISSVEITRETRRAWMGLLAKSAVDELENAWNGMQDKPGFSFLRQPETGLVMIRARAGGDGVRFNLGEMPVTRCTLRIESGQVGCAYIMGRSRRHAGLAALFDALPQNRDRHEEIRTRVLDPLARTYRERLREMSDKVDATKVDFYLRVRSLGFITGRTAHQYDQ